MTYEEWETSVPVELTGDSLWRVEAYRFALFLSDLAWRDINRLFRDGRTRAIADQLYRAAGNISSNIGEGYSRGTGKDRARFFEYALGSARECRDWYYKGRHVLGDKVTSHRLQLATRIVKLLLTMTSNERRSNRRIVPRLRSPA